MSSGSVRTVPVKLIDWVNPENNDWLAVNQFSILENGQNRRPDILVFVNGIPLGLLELKNPADKNATLKDAWNQIQTYRSAFRSFHSQRGNAHLGRTSAAMSSFSGCFEHYAPWKNG